MLFDNSFTLKRYKNAAYDIFFRILNRAFKTQTYYCYSLSDVKIGTLCPYINGAPPLHGFFELDYLYKLINPEIMTMDHSFAEKAYAKGDRCFGIIDNGILAHYSWYATSPTLITKEIEVTFPGDKVYMYNAFTDPRYRGNKLYPFAVSHAARIFFESGFTQMFTIIVANNFNSITAVEKIGFKFYGRFFVNSLGGNNIYSSSACNNHNINIARCL